MYLDYYHLQYDPFQFPADFENIFLSSSHLEALSAVTFGVVQRKGFLIVLGKPGLGKTTLLQAFLKDPEHHNLKKVPLPRSRVSFPELLQDIVQGLELPINTDETSGLLRQLYQALTQEYENGNNVVFLVDDAQDMPVETLENLRMISNLETPSEKIIQIVLIGRPDLWETLGRQELRQLKQRVAVRANLFPLSLPETLDYIHFRIEKAGGKGASVFTTKALKWMIRQGGGVPEKIDHLCREALKTGYELSCRPVTEKAVKKALGELDGVRRRRVRPWAVSSLAALLLAGGVYGLVRNLDFFTGRPGNVNQKVSAPDITAEPLAAKYPAKAFSLLTGSGSPDSGKEASRLPVHPLAAARAEIPEKSGEPKSGRTEKPSKAPTSGGETVPLDDQGKAQPERKAESRGPGSVPPKKKKEAVVRRVKKGDNFIGMVRDVYGASDQALLDYVKENNPGIKDFRNIREGEKIIFPKWKKAKGNVPPNPQKKGRSFFEHSVFSAASASSRVP